jgi:DNA transformation protein and related proteins
MTNRQIGTLRNLGPASARMMAEIGIRDEAALRRIGAGEAFRRACFELPERPSFNLLWALHGAIDDRDWRSYSEEEKRHLKDQTPG